MRYEYGLELPCHQVAQKQEKVCHGPPMSTTWSIDRCDQVRDSTHPAGARGWGEG